MIAEEKENSNSSSIDKRDFDASITVCNKKFTPKTLQEIDHINMSSSEESDYRSSASGQDDKVKNEALLKATIKKNEKILKSQRS